jgi:dihydrofolate synthase/folylpolyglutamate synthase
MKAPLFEISRRRNIRILGSKHGRYLFDLETPARSYRKLRLSLAGEFQTRNAALAVTAVESLESFPVREKEVRAALADTRWPGRLDEYRARRRTLLDSAHNVEGARCLKHFLLEHGPEEIHLTFGVMRDKEARRMGNLLFPLAQSIHLCPIENSRAADPHQVAAKHQRFRKRIHMHRDSRTALHAAWDSSSRSGLVVVAGSIYLLGELLPLIKADVRRRSRKLVRSAG